MRSDASMSCIVVFIMPDVCISTGEGRVTRELLGRRDGLKGIAGWDRPALPPVRISTARGISVPASTRPSGGGGGEAR